MPCIYRPHGGLLQQREHSSTMRLRSIGAGRERQSLISKADCPSPPLKKMGPIGPFFKGDGDWRISHRCTSSGVSELVTKDQSAPINAIHTRPAGGSSTPGNKKGPTRGPSVFVVRQGYSELSTTFRPKYNRASSQSTSPSSIAPWVW